MTEQDPRDQEAQRPSDPEELRREIEQTRSELGDTVEALAHKTDVKAQVSGAVDERREALRHKQEEVKERVSDLGQRVSSATPEDVKGAAAQVAHTAEERPFPAIAAAFGAGLALGWLIGRR